MTSRLILLSLAVVPFVFGVDTRGPKECLASLFAMAIVLTALHKTGIRPIKDMAILSIMIILLLSIWLCPPFTASFFGTDYGSFWNWKPMLMATLYFMLFCAVASAEDAKGLFLKASRVIVTVGCIQSVYASVQWFGMDQFFNAKPAYFMGIAKPENLINGSVTNPGVVGTFGQPTILASFLIMCLAFSNRWWQYAIIGIGLIATGSDMGIVGGLLVIAMKLIHSALAKPALMLITIVLFFCLFIGLIFGTKQIYSHSNGRIDEWKSAITDFNNSPLPESDVPQLSVKRYNLTGFGLGSYEVLRHGYKGIKWQQAHNEFVEMLYSNGIIGLVALIALICSVMSWFFGFGICKNIDLHYAPTLFAAICGAIFCSTMTFNFHSLLGAHCLYIVIIVGLAYNLLKGECNGRVL